MLARVRRSSLVVLFACLLGVPAGIGAFTFVYAKGFSYLSSDPRACVNCHVMNEQYDACLSLYRFAGKGDVQKGFEAVSGMPYGNARDLRDDQGRPLVQYPVACVDCHDPKTMLGETIDDARQGQLHAERAARKK